MSSIRSVAVVDEWALVRQGVEARMRRLGLRVVTATTSFHEYISGVEAHPARAADLVVVGHLTDVPQAPAIRRIADAGSYVLALSSSTSPTGIVELWSAGVHAVVGRNAQECELTEAVRSVANGGRYMGSSLLAQVFDRNTTLPARPRGELTPREREVLAELVSGATNEEISARLHIGTQTVKSHLSNIYDKLGVRRRSHAVRVALSHGLIA
jgi:DNA-binding NarL/FixJ family response regulator